MKSQLSALDIHYLVNELQFLVGGRIDKIYHPAEKEILLIFYVTSKGKSMLKIHVPNYMHLTDQKEFIVEPSGFCLGLRKHLNNARLKSVEQVGSERIVKFEFEVKKGIERLYVELFSKGNLVLCDKNNLIIFPLEMQKWSDRFVKAKEEYKVPQKEFNFLTINEDGLKQMFLKSTVENLVKSLATELGLGGVYAEEVCQIAKVDKNKPLANLSESEIKWIFNGVKKLRTDTPNPNLVYEGGKTVDVLPFELKLYKDLAKKEFKLFNSALNEFFIHQIVKTKSEYEKKLEKLNRIIEEQKSKIHELEEKEKINRQNADLIYHNYKLIEEVLVEMRKASEMLSWQKIKFKLRGHRLVKQVDEKEKSVVVEI